jgi:electron transport complex protein RnfG
MILAVLVTCVVASSGLAATYGVTRDRIAEQERLAEERSLRAVSPSASAFEKVVDPSMLGPAEAAAEPAKLVAVYRATDSSGESIGWGLIVASRGYAGAMQIVMGLDRDGKVTGVSILSHNETPGLGTKIISDEGFLPQFSGLPAGFKEADVKKLDVIAGATKSSNGVRSAVTSAGRVFDDVLVRAGGVSQ